MERRDFLTMTTGTLAAWFVRPDPARLVRRLARDGFAALRKEYDLGKRVHYLNHAAIGTVPRVVREAHASYDRRCEENPWLYIWGGGFDEALDEVRQSAASFLHCGATELALTRNTTEAFNQLAIGLPLGNGDEVLFSSLNHIGASACWRHHAGERGYTVRSFPFPVGDAPHLTGSDLVEIHRREIREKTRVLVFPHVDNMVGIRHPVRALGDMAREEGVEFVAVDGAQSAGMIPVDVAAMHVDFFAASAHKWLQAPKGLGLFYVAQKVQERFRPALVTWGQKHWSNDARKYEDYGTRDLPKVLALRDAVEFQRSLGEEARDEHLKSLFRAALQRVDGEAGLTWRSPRSFEGGGSLFAVEVKGAPAKDVAAGLFQRHGFVARPFQEPELNTLRISPHCMNTSVELARLLDLLRDEAV